MSIVECLTDRVSPASIKAGATGANAADVSTLSMTERIGGEHVKASPLRGLPEATAIRRQLRRREVGWDGSRRKAGAPNEQ